MTTHISQIEPHFLAMLRGERTHEECRAACAAVPDPVDQLRAKGATDADLEHRPRAEQGDSRTLLDLVRDGTWSLARGVAVVEVRRARERSLDEFVTRLYAEGAPFVAVDRRPGLTFVRPHTERPIDAVVYAVADSGAVEEVRLFPPMPSAVCGYCGHDNHEDGGLGCVVPVDGLRCGCGSHR